VVLNPAADDVHTYVGQRRPAAALGLNYAASLPAAYARGPAVYEVAALIEKAATEAK
jgi:hypothetical protein